MTEKAEAKEKAEELILALVKDWVIVSMLASVREQIVKVDSENEFSSCIIATEAL